MQGWLDCQEEEYHKEQEQQLQQALAVIINLEPPALPDHLTTPNNPHLTRRAPRPHAIPLLQEGVQE